MESFLKMSLRIFVTYCVFIYSTQVFAGISTSPTLRSEDSEGDTRIIPPSNLIMLNPNLIASKFRQLLRTDTTIKALHTDLLQRGFQAQTGLNNHWGFRGLFKGRDDKGKLRVGRTTLYMRDYTKPGSSDLAALVQIQIHNQKYSFYLIAPNGDFENPTEFARGPGGEISEKHANGFWHCMRHGLSGIGTACVTALTTCPRTGWVAYTICVAAACGGAAFDRMACCACDCSCGFLNGCCRFWVGCCDR